jgi:prepilin-type N-terminal cleavage/methylation domain-containing protein
MISSVISRLNDRRDAAADLGEDAGFTLIELMVVLLILAILLAIAIPTFLGVTGGANDRAAQSNINTALTTLKTQATQNNQSYTGLTTTVMSTDEPSLTWNQSTTATAATVTTQGPVDFYISADGNGAVIVSFSKNAFNTTTTGTCWWAVDNLTNIVDVVGPYGASAVPLGSAAKAPTGPGTFYGKSAPVAGACNPAIPPTTATWSNTFSGA